MLRGHSGQKSLPNGQLYKGARPNFIFSNTFVSTNSFTSLSKLSKTNFKMFKYMVVLALVACAAAAPQLLVRSGLDNEGAKQIGLPFANGWTDGPNNGLGPQVVVAHHAAPAITYAAHASPFVHHGVGLGVHGYGLGGAYVL